MDMKQQEGDYVYLHRDMSKNINSGFYAQYSHKIFDHTYIQFQALGRTINLFILDQSCTEEYIFISYCCSIWSQVGQ